MIRNGQSKTIIPVCLGMNAVDLPKEFKHIQAVDFTRVGAMQDLLLGLKKIVNPVQKKIQDYHAENSRNEVRQLLERAQLALETDDWKGADQFCEQALNKDAHCGTAYLLKLFSEKKVHNLDDLVKAGRTIDKSINYSRARQFCDESLKAKLEHCALQIRRTVIDKKSNDAIADVDALRSTARTAADMKNIKELYEKLLPSEEIQQKINECNRKIANIETEVMSYKKAQKKNIWCIVLTPIIAFICLCILMKITENVYQNTLVTLSGLVICVAPIIIEIVAIIKCIRNGSAKKRLIQNALSMQTVNTIIEKINAIDTAEEETTTEADGTIWSQIKGIWSQVKNDGKRENNIL